MRWTLFGVTDEAAHVIPANYQQAGAVVVYTYSLDPEEDVGDYTAVTETEFLGMLRMRKVGDVTWVPVTDNVLTTFHIKNMTVAVDVEIELTVPTPTDADVEKEITLTQAYQLSGTLDALGL